MRTIYMRHIQTHSLYSAGNQQQCFSLTPNQHQLTAISQPPILFSHSKSAPTTSHSQPNRAAHRGSLWKPNKRLAKQLSRTHLEGGVCKECLQGGNGIWRCCFSNSPLHLVVTLLTHHGFVLKGMNPYRDSNTSLKLIHRHHHAPEMFDFFDELCFLESRSSCFKNVWLLDDLVSL